MSLRDIQKNKDAAVQHPRPEENSRRFLRLRRTLAVVFAIGFFIGSGMLVCDAWQKNRSFQLYEDLQDTFSSSGFDYVSEDTRAEEPTPSLQEDEKLDSMPAVTDTPDTEKTKAWPAEEYREALAEMRQGLASLRQINEDLYGWIFVEGTAIDYPMVQGEDNEYYLNHAYSGEWLVNGAIFVDYRCSSSVKDNYNTVVYGHNITTGAMFHDVTKFLSQDVFTETYICVYTEEGIYVYEPFSVYETRYDYDYFRTDFSSAEEFISFAEEVRDNSEIRSKANVTFDENDRILTLSTCTNGAFYARYALHARLIGIVEDP